MKCVNGLAGETDWISLAGLPSTISYLCMRDSSLLNNVLQNERIADASHLMYAVCALYQKVATVYHTWLTQKWEVVTGDAHRFGHYTYLATWLSMTDAIAVGEDMFPHLPPWTFLRWTSQT